MSWKTIDRVSSPAEMGPGLSEPVRDKIRTFFDRYPTKRAAILPAPLGEDGTLRFENGKLRFESSKPLDDVGRLAAAGVRFRTLHVERPDLETVFLTLTGRSLRD